MSRKLIYLLCCIVVIVALMTWHEQDTFYRDVGIRGFDRKFWQYPEVQNSFVELITDKPSQEGMQYVFANEGSYSKANVKKASVEMEGSVSNNGSGSSINESQNNLEKIDTEKRMRQQYYQLRNVRINPFKFKFIESGENICDKNEEPFLVILCLTKFYNIETREAIRETWGSVAKTKQWPSFRFKIPTVKLVFLFGDPGKSLAKNTIITDEKHRFGDIAVANFIDTYFNLTLKVMMGLKWVSQYCSKAKFVAKVDEDTFLHVVNLIMFLSSLPIPSKGVVIGLLIKESDVKRTGQWAVQRTRFPMRNYPNYTNGNCYVISGNAVGNIFKAAERMPYIKVEDVFITGIIRTTLGIKLIDNKGFSGWYDKPPKLCGFHNSIRIAATNTDNERKRILWKALGYKNLKNCYNVTKHADI